MAVLTGDNDGWYFTFILGHITLSRLIRHSRLFLLSFSSSSVRRECSRLVEFEHGEYLLSRLFLARDHLVDQLIAAYGGTMVYR